MATLGGLRRNSTSTSYQSYESVAAEESFTEYCIFEPQHVETMFGRYQRVFSEVYRQKVIQGDPAYSEPEEIPWIKALGCDRRFVCQVFEAFFPEVSEMLIGKTLCIGKICIDSSERKLEYYYPKDRRRKLSSPTVTSFVAEMQKRPSPVTCSNPSFHVSTIDQGMQGGFLRAISHLERKLIVAI